MLLAAFIATFLAPIVQAKDRAIEAKSAALGDVKSAVALAGEGDTVIIPAGEASWSSTLVISKGITLRGATAIAGAGSSNPSVTDATIILNDVLPQRLRPPSSGGQQGTPREHSSFVGGGATLHGQKRADSKSNAADGPNANHMPAIIVARLKPDQSFRLTGFTFRVGSLTGKRANNSAIVLKGTCPSVRVDNCHFDQLVANTITTFGQIYGVVDHCVWDSAQHVESFQIYHDGWAGYSHGDGSWADDNHFGSNQFLFIETNTFRQPGLWSGGSIDCYGGGRYVARYNYFNNAIPNSHGTESSGRFRGTRAVEIYNNRINWTASHQSSGQLRSGTLLQHNNTWTGNAGGLKGHSIILTCYRQFRPFPFWGGVTGNNRLDSNDSHGLYASGKHTGENNSSTLIVANAGWKANQWVGYSVSNVTQRLKMKMGAVFHPSSYITGNTSDTITFARDDSFGGPNMTFNTGDSYEIYKLLVALDQPGRGKGNFLADKDPVVTGSWPHQALEPVYAWGNIYDNSQQLDVASPYPTIQENRDFYNQKTPFDGTVGVGVGKLADRPKTCTPGVAYWASDEGEWDSIHEGPDGQLYVCSVPNTWSLYYKPYMYPHPLVTGTPASSAKAAQDQQHGDRQSSSSK